jgi:hypothetical protein
VNAINDAAGWPINDSYGHQRGHAVTVKPPGVMANDNDPMATREARSKSADRRTAR